MVLAVMLIDCAQALPDPSQAPPTIAAAPKNRTNVFFIAFSLLAT
jgi:hypothetical protein